MYEIKGNRSEFEPSRGMLEGVATLPSRLYAIGDTSLLEVGGLAISGARKATPYGLFCARRFAGMAAESDAIVITGGARGVDTEATKAALDAGGKCIVVLGGGIDYLYPKENASLFQRVIDEGGLILSEQDWNTPPRPYMFRTRNRIITGLCNLLLVIECALPSGTFSTADDAFAQGKPVYAVPGAITNDQSLGTNALISVGAGIVFDDSSFYDAMQSSGVFIPLNKSVEGK